MRVVPITLKAANEHVAKLHRHHKPSVGHKISIGLKEDDELIGVAILSRPVARKLDDGKQIEVIRCCTDGTYNACSLLYSNAAKIAQLLGYERIITYTLPSEGGASLRASGFTEVGLAGGRNWNCSSRPRQDTLEHLQVRKTLWEKKLNQKEYGSKRQGD